MKTLYQHFQKFSLVVATTLSLLTSRSALIAGTTNSPAVSKGDALVVQPPFIEPAVPQSTFRLPKKLAEGRNPFFPQSVSHIGVVATSKTNQVVAPIAELTLKGISGTPEQPLAIINNRTFTAGEEGDVPIGTNKVRVRCIEIKMSEGTVLVQVSGQSRELRLAPSK